MADNYREYLYDDFIKMVNLKVDAVGAKQLISALPIFVKDSDHFKQQFTVTVYRDPMSQQLQFTMFLGDGSIRGETLDQERFKLIIGNYIIADILNETIMAHIPPEQLASAMQNAMAGNMPGGDMGGGLGALGGLMGGLMGGLGGGFNPDNPPSTGPNSLHM